MEALFKIESDENFKTVFEGIIKTLHKSEVLSDMGVESNIKESAKEDFRKLITSNNFNLTKVTEHLINTNWDTNKTKIVINIIEENKVHLLYSLILRHNSIYGDTVVDYDWTLKLILGTSDLKMLRYPILQMKVLTVNSCGDQTQTLYDLSKETLSKLIAVLEGCLEIK